MSTELQLTIGIIIAFNFLVLYATYYNNNYNSLKRDEAEKELKKLKELLEIETCRRRQCEKIIARGRIHEK